MKKLLSLALLTFVGYASQAASTDYFVDDTKIESVLESSETISLSTASLNMNQNILKTNGDNNQIVAVVLGIFLGNIAIHRVYLGGKPSLILIYFITCGGIFGIVPLVDWISILINDVDNFVDNDKFIAWSGN